MQPGSSRGRHLGLSPQPQRRVPALSSEPAGSEQRVAESPLADQVFGLYLLEAAVVFNGDALGEGY